jgi:DNA-binding response OmpR family regulator
VAQGHEVVHACDVPAALARLDASFDAAVLDLLVPGGSGYDVLAVLRTRCPDARVLLLTARDSVEDRVEGLDRGADDYLVKPFALSELAARLRALLRRPSPTPDVIRAGKIELDVRRRRASLGDALLNLTPREFDLLLCLTERQGEVLTRKEILRLVWSYDFDPGTNVVEVHVTRLRRKLEDEGVCDLIRTVRGVGYVLSS